jgi:GPR1/FUN34/yaaH family
LLAGLGEVRRNNIFGYTAFSLYGGFWMSIGTIEIVSLLSNGEAAPANPNATQAMLFMVFLFTVMLWILTFKMNKTICSLFFLLLVTCLLLFFGVDNETVDKVGGYFGICTSANAFWLAFVELYNDVFGEGSEVIPLGHWNSNRFQSAGAAHSPGRIHGHWPFLMPRESHTKSENARPSCDVENGNGTAEECLSTWYYRKIVLAQ